LTSFEQTHKIFSFHPALAELHGIEVKAPWECHDACFPPPHPDFLDLHYVTGVSRAMRDDNELDSDDEDDEELSELEEEVQNDAYEQVRVWLHGCRASLDCTLGDIGDIETFANSQRLVSV
jgi:hypothetical protein